MLERDCCTLRYPVLIAGAWTRLLTAARGARRGTRPVKRGGRCLADRRSRRTHTADGRDGALIERLSAATGYSPEMARLVLDRMAADWRAPALNALLNRVPGSFGTG